MTSFGKKVAVENAQTLSILFPPCDDNFTTAVTKSAETPRPADDHSQTRQSSGWIFLMIRSTSSAAQSGFTPPGKTLTSVLLLGAFFSSATEAKADAVSSSVVEELVFKVAPERVDDFIRRDAEVWTRFLSTQEGFIDKRVWTSEAQPDEVRIIIRWRSRQDWNRIPKTELQKMDAEFRAAMGGENDFQVVESNAYGEAESNPHQPGVRIATLTGKNQAWLSAEQEILVAYDHVYRKEKRYRAVPLRHVLEVSFQLDQIDQDAAHLVFECADGYQKTMPLRQALSADGWIAVQDLDAPERRQWAETHEKSLAPY